MIEDSDVNIFDDDTDDYDVDDYDDDNYNMSRDEYDLLRYIADREAVGDREQER